MLKIHLKKGGGELFIITLHFVYTYYYGNKPSYFVTR